MKQSAKETLPPCYLHNDCHKNKDGKCTALSDISWESGDCSFYKTREQFLEGCRISLMRLLELGRTDLLVRYGSLEMYAALLRKVESKNRGGADETV